MSNSDCLRFGHFWVFDDDAVTIICDRCGTLSDVRPE